MTKARRPMAAMAIASVLALSGAGAAWACDGSGGGQSGSSAGTYPGESSSAGTYPGETGTTSSDSAGTTATAASATTRHARRVRAHRRHHSS
jgi:hypothetical protein